MSGGANGISVVMIARNGERYLSLALRSLWRVADEIVFVDTGSTDASVEIARSHDCRIFEFAWCDDFSKAKNYGIDQARCGWIMNVDADEVLYDRRAPEILAGALREAAAPAYVVWVDNLFDSGKVEPVKVLRLFRNTPRIRFTNPVHESIGESLYANWPGFIPPVLDIHLRHYGYLSANAQGKHGRNLALLRGWVDSEPLNIYANYKLAGTLFETGRGSEALVYLERTFGLFAECRERESYPFLGAFLTIYRGLLAAEGMVTEAERCESIVAGWR